MRTLAWLNATPKPPEGSPRTAAAAQGARLSRIEQMKKDRIKPQMPPNPLPQVVNRLVEIGLTEDGSMGASRLSWREIDAWCNRSGVDLPPWEARLIRSLSAAYLAESRAAESETCPPPWRREVTQQERDTEESRLQMVLG